MKKLCPEHQRTSSGSLLLDFFHKPSHNFHALCHEVIDSRFSVINYRGLQGLEHCTL